MSPPTTRRRRRRYTSLRAGLVSLFVGFAVTALLASPASAHDELEATVPANGANVASVPAEVVLTFAEPPLALGMTVQVDGADGTNHASGSPLLAGSTVTQAIQPGAPAGQYTVHWRVVADDGHPVSGSFTFVASAAGAAGAATTGAVASRPATDAVPTSQDSTSTGWWVAAGLAVVLAVGTAVAALARRRRDPATRDVREGSPGD